VLWAVSLCLGFTVDVSGGFREPTLNFIRRISNGKKQTTAEKGEQSRWSPRLSSPSSSP
jgi:hypothetical protein